MNPLSSDYVMNVLVVHKKDSESYKEVVQDYAQSMYVNTHVKTVSHTEFSLEDLKKYDLIYPDVNLVDSDNREEIANKLTDYVRDGGNLFLEENLYKIFPKEVFGMSKITEVNLKNQTFDFPIVPQKHENLQKLWKIYSVKKKQNNFYNTIRSIYHKIKGDKASAKSPDVYDIDLTKIDVKVHAVPGTAVSLVNSNGFSLLSINNYGNGNVLWTVNHIPKRGTYFGKQFITRLDLGYPDPTTKNFHFGYTTINYLIRNTYLDFITKEKYGFSLQKVFGAYGRPSFSWQNHLDLIEVWQNDEMVRWIDILKDENQIPTFSVIRGAHKDWGIYHGVLILNLNEEDNSDTVFTRIGSDTPYLLSGTRLQQVDGSYIETEKVASPFVVDWNEDGKKDLIIGAGDGNIYYYQNVSTNENPNFIKKEAIKEGKKGLNVGSNASPFIVDWDEDGKKDLIVGAGDGNIYYYQNVGTNENPQFLNKEAIKEGKKDLNVGSNAKPVVVDWDEDGKKDLIVGAGDGKIYYY
ncbi:MAG: VCBS repeat-containing protein, partial [Thermoplasmatales archaeon]|nr:VCBS repeat-containing protein [Thermoplasmatales archaeon]